MRLFLLALLSLFLNINLLFGQLPDDFYDELYSTDYENVMGITFDEAGRLFIWEKAGRIHLIDSSGVAVSTPVIDISERVANWKDHGLMSVALDPGFQYNGYIYLYYTMDMHWYKHYGTSTYHPDTTSTYNPSFGRVSRFQLDPTTNFRELADGTEHVLLGQTPGDGVPLVYPYHGIGSIIVGEDGTLLLSAGDTSSNTTDLGGEETGAYISAGIAEGVFTPDQDLGSYKAQYLGGLNGKVLRIDPQTGAGVPSNPYYDADNPRAAPSRIWALGFRNPYRIALWPETGSHFPEDANPGIIMAGDVGNGSWEELNVIRKGGENFGWPLVEGVRGNWGFWSQPPMPNPMARNPLYNTGNCDKEFFTFRELLHRPYGNNLGSAPVNPCDPSQAIPESAYPMQESLPALAWSNARWNPPARAVTADTLDGTIEELTLDAPRSPVTGDNFNGYSSLAGTVYTADTYPEEYHGKYFGIDYSGWIKVFDFDDNYKLQTVDAFHNNSKDIIHLALNPKDGLLYYVNVQNEVRKISYGGNPPPVAIIDADRFYGTGPLTVQFDGSQSYDSNLPIISYLWDFGDGATAEGIAPNHTFQAAGAGPQSFTVTLTVTDSLGETNLTNAIVSLNNTPPVVDITSFEDGDRYPMAFTSSLALFADVTDAEHNDEELLYQWRMYLHHNDHYHPEPVDYNRQSYALVSPLGCDFEVYWYRIELTVTDPEGLSTTDSRTIHPNCDGSFVDWTELTGTAEPTQNLLNWGTVREDGAAQFDIQRSTDFFTFETIGSVAAASTTTVESMYTFTDKSPLQGTNIYRIKVYSEDRAYTYSNMVTLDYPPKAPVTIYPNPVKNVINIELENPTEPVVQFELFNTAGVRLWNTSWTTEVNEPMEKQIFTTLLQNGFYVYRIRNGELEQSGKLVISK